MKLLIAWLRKDGRCRCWTNGDEAEHAVISVIVFRDGIKRIAEKEGISFSSAYKKLLAVMEKVNGLNFKDPKQN